MYTDKKEKKIFLIYREIQIGAVAKSYMRKGSLLYEEMRKYFPIYEEAVSHIWLCNCSTLNFPIYEENFSLSFFYQCRILYNKLTLQCSQSHKNKNTRFELEFFMSTTASWFSWDDPQWFHTCALCSFGPVISVLYTAIIKGLRKSVRERSARHWFPLFGYLNLHVHTQTVGL